MTITYIYYLIYLLNYSEISLSIQAISKSDMIFIINIAGFNSVF